LIAPYQQEVYFTHEMRYGTRTECKRRWSRQGKRPCCKVKLGYQWGYLYVAINPFKADLFAMYYSHLDKDCFTHYEQMLSKHVDKQNKDKDILLIGDKATAHTATKHVEKMVRCCDKVCTFAYCLSRT